MEPFLSPPVVLGLIGFLGAFYAYFGYPAALLLWARVGPRPVDWSGEFTPSVSILLPVHNEEKTLRARLENLDQLDYPRDRLEVIVVSDGSTDSTMSIAREFAEQVKWLSVLELPEQSGKAGALNRALSEARNEIVVFTDAGILVATDSLRALAAPFESPHIGCVSGEDHVAGGGGEALYGRYELFLRTQESRVASIVGASGSYYAQRRVLCASFPEGVAPDFLSVLRTVDAGYRSVTEPGARGVMRATTSHGREFRRKVRTLVRGMTGLFAHAHLLNPLRSGSYAFVLFSHKLMRWFVPFFLLVMLGSHLALLSSGWFRVLAVPHLGFYLAGFVGLVKVPWLRDQLPVRVATYFITVNAAILVAWWKYLGGTRQEIWRPTVRA